MEVIDSFLPEEVFKDIRDSLLCETFPWYWNDSVVRGDGKDCQLVHPFFYSPDGVVRPKSSFFPIITPILDKLEVDSIGKIKANLTYRTLFNRNTGYHIDIKPPHPAITKTAIFYINTNNGCTKIEKGGKVKSVANRMVIFDSDIRHAAVSCTDERRRIVINFNYG